MNCADRLCSVLLAADVSPDVFQRKGASEEIEGFREDHNDDRRSYRRGASALNLRDRLEGKLRLIRAIGTMPFSEFKAQA